MPEPGGGEPFHLAGLILARGGSESIPLKNLAPLCGRSLLARALDAAATANCFHSLWVSTDHVAIAAEAVAYPAASVRVFRRSPEHARSDSPSVDAVAEFLSARSEVSAVGLIQCTSPFADPAAMRRAADFLTQSGGDSAFAVTRAKLFRWGESSRTPLNFDPADRPRRQDWRGDLVENGMFYFVRRRLVIEEGVLQGGNISLIEVSPDRSLEIDTPLDLAIAEAVAKASRLWQESSKGELMEEDERRSETKQ